MRYLFAPGLFLSIALLVVLTGGGDSAGQPAGKKAGKKGKGGEKAKPEPERKPPTAWEEYLEFAPQLSMSVDHFSAQLFRPTVDIAGRPLKAPAPHDARLKKAFADIAAAKQDEKKGVDRALGKKMTPEEQAAFDANVKKLAEKGIGGAISGNLKTR